MERYAGSLMTDAEQLAAQGDMISHGDQLAYLMKTVSNGHTFMSPKQSYDVTTKALLFLTLEEVNEAAAKLCSHITGLNNEEEGIDGVLVAVACTPKMDDTYGPSYVDEESFIQCILDACQIPVQQEEDVVVPHSLVPDSVIEKVLPENPPFWNGGSFTDGTTNTSPDQFTRPFTLR